MGNFFAAMTDHREQQREQNAKVFTNELEAEDELAVEVAGRDAVRCGVAQRTHPSSLC